MRALSLLFCLFAVTGCFLESPTDPGPINQEVVLAPGQSTGIDGTNLSLKFIGVTGDSRCPADALCVLGGSATVKVEVSGSSGSRELTFETGNLKPITYDDWSLELVQLVPYPFSATPIRHEDYRATLRVKR
jgi:hypothetical protein